MSTSEQSEHDVTPAPPAKESTERAAQSRREALLDVSYEEKELAKAAGARWDKEAKVWFAPIGADLEKLKQWVITPLDVPFEEKDLAKAAGARWDMETKAWFGPPGADLEKLEQWIITPLDVEYADKDLAKAAGARWNRDWRQWFAPRGADIEKLARWVPGTEQHREEAKARASETSPAISNSPALNTLGIRPETLNAGVFRDTWRSEGGKALFPHHLDAPAPGAARAPLAPEEFARNHETLPEASKRGFWESNGATRDDVKKIVVVERAIDALSYHQIKPDDHTLYVSTGGGPLTPAQQDSIREGDVLTTITRQPNGEHVSALPKGLVVVAAFSNSKGGAELARQLKDSLPPGVTYERNAPTHGRYWNDTLQIRERDYIRDQSVKPVGRGRELSR